MIWYDYYQITFEKIKPHLSNPHILVLLVPVHPLLVYLAVHETSMGCVLKQHDESSKKEHEIYYIGKKFANYESRYSILEKTCCVFVWKRKDHAIICSTTPHC